MFTLTELTDLQDVLMAVLVGTAMPAHAVIGRLNDKISEQLIAKQLDDAEHAEAMEDFCEARGPVPAGDEEARLDRELSARIDKVLSDSAAQGTAAQSLGSSEARS